VLHITTRPGTVQVVSGMAGTGKSTMLTRISHRRSRVWVCVSCR
jgi:guanylate kinase